MTIDFPKCPLCAVDQDLPDDVFESAYPDLLMSRPDLIAEKLCDDHLSESRNSLESVIKGCKDKISYINWVRQWTTNLNAVNHEILKRKVV